MKRVHTILAFTLLASFWFAPSAVALTIEDVINMSNIGVADSVIISAIESSETEFKLTPNDIIELTRAGVGQSVIEAMQKTIRKEAPSPPLARPDVEAKPPPDVVPQPPAKDSEPTRSSSPAKAPSSSGSANTMAPRVVPLPADVKQLKRRYDTGKYTSAAAMAFDLLTGPNKDRYATATSTIYYYLGKSLYKLGFYHSAHTIFLRVAKDGPAGPHFNGCLSLLTRTSEILKEYKGFTDVLEGTSTKDLPRRVKSTLLYLIGLSQYLNQDFNDCRNTLDGVSINSEFYAKAQFISAMAMYQMGDNRRAVKTFRELVEGRQLVGVPDEIKDVQDLSVLNMARVYYRVEDFERAELLYALVPRDSRYWPHALYESAYANFWQEDYNVSLGLLLTLKSPFFDDKIFVPEARILETLVYYNLCEYDRVDELIREFQSETKPIRDSLRAFSNDYALVLDGDLEAFHSSPRAMEKAMEAYSALFRSEQGREARGIPPEVLITVDAQRDFQNLHFHLNMLQQEADLLDSGKTKWKGTALGKTLLHSLRQDEGKLKADAGRYMLEQLGRIEKDLSGLLGQSDIIRFEVVNAQKEEYEDKFRNPVFVETYDSLEQSYATESSLIYWPFTGEFWEDELGYYRFTESGSCRARAAER